MYYEDFIFSACVALGWKNWGWMVLNHQCLFLEFLSEWFKILQKHVKTKIAMSYFWGIVTRTKIDAKIYCSDKGAQNFANMSMFLGLKHAKTAEMYEKKVILMGT